jgi:hypothetical protein
LPGLAAKYGIDPAQVAAVAAKTSTYKTDLGDAVTKAAAAKAANSTKDASRDDAMAFTRRIGRWIKAHPNYSPEDGATLAIIGHDRTVDLRTRRPQLKAIDRNAGKVEFRFKKLNSHGIHLYSKRGEETVWKQIATHTRTKFVDDRPLLVSGKPELRIYRAIYFVKDEPIGEWSNEIEITCAP